MNIIIALLLLFQAVTAVTVATAFMFNIGIEKVTIGRGMEVFSIGKVKVCAFLIDASVSMTHSGNEHFLDSQRPIALDFKPIWVQITTILSGPIVLFFIAFFVIGPDALHSVSAGFVQIVKGALSPFNTAQIYLQSLASHQSFLMVMAVCAAKLTALHLMPFPTCRLGAALIILIKNVFKEFPEEKFYQLISIPLLLLMVSWTIAVVYYLARNI